MKPHEILGVSEGASSDEIKTAYRRAAMRCHPDRGGSAEEFDRVAKAYEILSRQKCSLCNGTGKVSRKNGAFVVRDDCPECWAK